MVIVLDWEDDDSLDPAISSRLELPCRPKHPPQPQPQQEPPQLLPELAEKEDVQIANPNAEAFAVALGCYPIASSIACHLDLNSLHDLALTCRQFRSNLLPYRYQLMRQTLRCVHDEQEMVLRMAERMRRNEPEGSSRAWSGTLTGGKVSRCARDLVGECRRCGMVVCRNCTIKAPAKRALDERHRRLCKTCMKAPLRFHTTETSSGPDLAFTAEAFSRGPCCCPDSVYICLSCGNALRGADTTYMRGWTWRTRYSTYLGGLGTGIGEGHEGVGCGKESKCLAAKEIEKEIDCDADEMAELRAMEKVSTPHKEWGGTSFFTQEIEGIGGIVKKKVKKRIRVGYPVKEYEDERDHGNYLSREKQGLNRSWCFWCSRIIPSNRDRPFDNELLRTLSSGSSTSSVNLHDE